MSKNIISQGILFKDIKKKLKKEGFDVMSQVKNYDSLNQQLISDYSEAINRTSETNPLKNKNVIMNLKLPTSKKPVEVTGYVNNVGYLRPYIPGVDYQSTTYGKNGCPSYMSSKNITKPVSTTESDNGWGYNVNTNPKLFYSEWYAMQPGQACGFEGENLYVDSIGSLGSYEISYNNYGYLASGVSPQSYGGNDQYSFETCETLAIERGNQYFGLANYNSSTGLGECILADSMSAAVTNSPLNGNIVAVWNYFSSPSSSILLAVWYPTMYAIANGEWQTVFTNTDMYWYPGINQSNIVATWGANCNSNGYNVQENNVGSDVLTAVQNADISNEFESSTVVTYTIGTDGNGNNLSDPAYGCPKNFSLTYQCGNDPSINTINVPGESWGNQVTLNCSSTYNSNYPYFFIQDDGYFYVAREQDITFSNNVATLNSGATPIYTGNLSGALLSSNENLVFTQNYFGIQYSFSTTSYICNPSKTLCLCSNGTNIVFVVYPAATTTTSSNQTVGINNNAAMYSINNLPSTPNLGQMAWVDAQGYTIPYTNENLQYSTTYIPYPNSDSYGNDLTQLTGTLEQVQSACNSNPDCAGFTMNGGTGYMKNSNMFPTGERQVLNGATVYVRVPEINTSTTNSTCSTTVNNVNSLMYNAYPTWYGLDMGQINCSEWLFNPNAANYTNLDEQGNSLTTQINALDNTLYTESAALVDNTNVMNQESQKMFTGIKQSAKALQKEKQNVNKNYVNVENFQNNNIPDKYMQPNKLNQMAYLDTLLNNSKTYVLQQNYIIVTLIVFLIGLIIVLMKIKK